MSKLIGVKYIGPKPVMKDSVNNTGAVWKNGIIHNFSEPLARRLLHHSGSFEAAPVSADGDTFLGGVNGSPREAPAVAYQNLANMDLDQLEVFYRREYGMPLDTKDRTVDEVRNGVYRKMLTANMDELAAEKAVAQMADGKTPYTIMVTAAEHQALMADELVWRLVPKEVSEPVDADLEPAIQQAQSLDDLVASLDKNELIELAEQENVEGVSKHQTEEKVRDVVLQTLKQRALDAKTDES